MRKMHGLLATVLGLTLACGLYGCGGSGEPTTSADVDAPAEELAEDGGAAEEAANTGAGELDATLPSCNYHYKLNEISSFDDVKRGLSIERHAAINYDENDKALLIGLDGKPMLDGQAIRGIDYLANGVYTYAADVEEVNSWGLVSLTDGMLLGPEAALVSYKTDDPADARFLEVIYATEETDNKDECFVFATDAYFKLSPDEEDVMYKGYGKVYDLKNKRFVEGVQIDNAGQNALQDLGDAFVVAGTDDVWTMYDENGKALLNSDSVIGFSSSSLVMRDGDKSVIVDSSAKTTFETEDIISAISGTTDFYRLSKDEKDYIIDANGDLALEDGYEEVNAAYHGMFVVTDGDVGKIVDSNGNVLADDVQTYSTEEILPGIITYKNTSDKYALCLSDGRVIEAGDYSSDWLVFDDDDDNCLVLADGTFSLKVGNNETIGKGLVDGRGDESAYTYGVYELFTGKELLDSSYERIHGVGGYIFALKDGTWTVYEAELVQD